MSLLELVLDYNYIIVQNKTVTNAVKSTFVCEPLKYLDYNYDILKDSPKILEGFYEAISRTNQRSTDVS